MADYLDFDNDFFDNLGELGFSDLQNLSIYEDEVNKDESCIKHNGKSTTSPIDCIYDKKLECPVCNREILIPSVKLSSIRILSRDSDFMIHYQEPSPLLYDAWLCRQCGYAAFSNRFNSVTEKQIKLIKESICSKWKSNKTYPSLYSVDTAIEMHQMVLLNSVIKRVKDSEKALCCLKLSWLYRLNKDTQNEKKFMYQALQGFTKALEFERGPIAGLDDPSLEYLIGELHRRLDDNTNALLWFSKVLGNTRAKHKIKDLARDQKDIIQKLQAQDIPSPSNEEPKKNKTFFSGFFGFDNKQKA